jgi:tetratricopeptide (TPR) repeat protein
MRGSRRVRRKLVWLIDYLRMFYSTDELRQAARIRLSSTQKNIRDIEYALAISQALGSEPLGKALETYALESLLAFEHRLEEFLDLSGDDKDLVPKAERLKLIKETKERLPDLLRKANVKFSIQTFMEEFLGLPLSVPIRKGLLETISTSKKKELVELRNFVFDQAQKLRQTFGKKVYEKMKMGFSCGEIGGPDDNEGFNAAAERFACPPLHLLKLHGHELSEAEVRDALRVAPDGAYFWMLLGKALAAIPHRKSEAEAAYRKAIEICPEAPYWIRLAELLSDLPERGHDYEQALRNAIKLAPDVPRYWSLLGNAILINGFQAPDTEDALRKACQLDPENSDNWIQFALYLASQSSRDEEALKALEMATEKGAGDFYISYGSALVNFAIGRADDALNHISVIFEYLRDHEDTGAFHSVIPTLLQFAVMNGLGPNALRLIDENNLTDRLRPLREALAAAVAQDASLLNGVAPEVRLPAFEILKDIAPDLVGDTA